MSAASVPLPEIQSYTVEVDGDELVARYRGNPPVRRWMIDMGCRRTVRAKTPTELMADAVRNRIKIWRVSTSAAYRRVCTVKHAKRGWKAEWSWVPGRAT
ncbi:hypothetical protein [Nonomuraea sp. SYSU D8015]|uniref:hypothetical protein n=1 Tax=Nonomuraea sp. SYSU D8015 TaxID=2593644 RepID=UPI0016601463|nr:hypothetical protein [Nonomuraea sp. SYSU D8015]